MSSIVWPSFAIMYRTACQQVFVHGSSVSSGSEVFSGKASEYVLLSLLIGGSALDGPFSPIFLPFLPHDASTSGNSRQSNAAANLLLLISILHVFSSTRYTFKLQMFSFARITSGGYISRKNSRPKTSSMTSSISA